MPDEIYEVVSQGARYWFLFLMVLIVWRSYRWLARDRRQRRKRLKLLPDAGYVGELVVVQGSADLPDGLALPVSGEGILGCIRGDDVYVPVKGVAKRHLWFEFDDEQGLRVEPFGRRGVEVDGRTLTGRRAHAYLLHGSRLTVGEAVLRLRMFAGYDLAGVCHAQVADTDAPEEAKPEPSGLGASFTPQQLAAFQQMQWMAAWQAAQAQGVNPLTAPNNIPGAIQPTVGMPGMVPLPNGMDGAVQPYAGTPGAGQPSGGVSSPVSATLATDEGVFQAPPKTALNNAILLPNVTEEGAESNPVSQTRVQRHMRRNPLPPILNGEEESLNSGDQPQPEASLPLYSDAPDSPTADALWASVRAQNQDRSLRQTPEKDREERPLSEKAMFAPRVTFYPPELDDPGEPTDAAEGAQSGTLPGGEEVWPYATYPQSDARFTHSGYTYPEYVEPNGDEPYEYADEDEAPRSLYVEPDEAAQAKRVLWDRYLKGGRRR